MTAQYTELHRHLDAALRPATLAELIVKNNLEYEFKTEKEVREKFWLTEKMSSLSEVLECFVVFQKCLTSAGVLTRITQEALEDARKEGIKKLELRYSPSFVSEFSNIPWGQGLAAIKNGLQSRGDLEVGLICIISRDHGLENAKKVMDFAVTNQDDFIGVDLAGNENEYPCSRFRDIFKRAHDAKLPVTIHAGESLDLSKGLKNASRNIWEAIDVLGAKRIGHGILAADDAVLLKRMARDKILIESCPTSNYITNSVEDWKAHPLPKFLAAGVPVSISTDDPGIFGVTIDEEYSRAQKRIGLSEKDLKKVMAFAEAHSFLKSTS